MKKYLFIISIVFYSFTSAAQDSSAVNDSAHAAADSANVTSYVIDTTLQPSGFVLSEDTIQHIKKLKQFEYAIYLDSLLRDEQKKREGQKPTVTHTSWLEAFFASTITEYFFWILAAFFVLFILYKLFFTEGIFQRQSPKIKVTETVTEEEKLNNSSDYEPLILKSIAEKNFRLAVRYLYLQTLLQLSENGFIDFAIGKTDHQYLLELNDEQFKDKFSSLLLNYEYIWYGHFEIGAIAFAGIQNEFKQFSDSL